VNIKTTLKSTVAVAALFAVAAPVANAADDTLKSGNKNSLKISGQLARALWHADDGVSEKTFNTEGSWSTSRVRWIASGKVNENVTAGATIEAQIPSSNAAASMTLGTQQADGTQNAAGIWGVRHQYVWVNHKKFGKLSLGQTDPGSNGSSEVNYSMNGMFGGSAAADYGSGIFYQNTATASAPTASTATVGAATTNIDGISRTDVVRYDTPRFAGVQGKFGLIAGGNWDVGLNYAGKFGPVKVAAKAGYADTNAAASANFNASGSITALHDSGLNATFAIGKTNYAGPNSKGIGAAGASAAGNTIDTNFDGVADPHFTYWAIGYNAKIFGAGATGFLFGVNHTENAVLLANHDDNESDNYSFSVVQKFSSIGAQIGLKYQAHSYDSKTNVTQNTFDDVDVIALQTVFAF